MLTCDFLLFPPPHLKTPLPTCCTYSNLDSCFDSLCSKCLRRGTEGSVCFEWEVLLPFSSPIPVIVNALSRCSPEMSLDVTRCCNVHSPHLEGLTTRYLQSMHRLIVVTKNYFICFMTTISKPLFSALISHYIQYSEHHASKATVTTVSS